MQYFILYTLYYYFFSHYSFLFLLLLADNLILSVNTVCQIYKLSFCIPIHAPTLDRYLFYFSLVFSNLFFTILCFGYYPMVTYLLFLFNLSKNVFLSPLFLFVKKKIKKLFLFLFYQLSSMNINHLCTMTLQYNPCLNNEDVMLLYESYLEYTQQFFKNLIVLTIIKSVANSTTFSLNLIKKIYNLKAEVPYRDPYPNSNDVEKIKKILSKRQWEAFFNPYMIDILLKIYQKNDKINLYIEEKVSQVELCTAKLFTVLTLTQLTQSFLTIPIVSLLLVKELNRERLVLRLISLLLSYLLDSYLFGIIINEYDDFVIVIIEWLFKKYQMWFKENYRVLFHFNDLNLILLNHVGFLSMMPNNIYIILFCILNAHYKLISLYFLFFGYLSNYHFIHLIFLAIVYYIGINIYYRKTTPKPKIPLKLVTDYKSVTKQIRYEVYCPVLNCIQNPKYNILPL